MQGHPDHPLLELGYHFWPKHHPHAIGHPGLDIHITGTPTQRHYDPRTIRLLVYASGGSLPEEGIGHLTVIHPWAHHESYQVAPGMIIITDRKDKKVEAFTFGGTLIIDSGKDGTTCTIQSDAPILEVDAHQPALMKLVEEVEIVLAKARANWIEEMETFETMLAEIPPSLLFSAILESLIKQFQHVTPAEEVEIRDMCILCETEKHRRMHDGNWPEHVPSIEELLTA